MMVTTVGVVVPLIVSLGFDPLWFGIFMTMMMELALITPPVGLNLFVAQNIRLSRGGISDVYIGVLPFAFAMMVFVTLLIYFRRSRCGCLTDSSDAHPRRMSSMYLSASTLSADAFSQYGEVVENRGDTAKRPLSTPFGCRRARA